WMLTDEQKSGVFDRDTRAIVEAFEVGIISQKTALKELRQLGRYTNRWNNITDKDIEDAEDEVLGEQFPGDMPNVKGPDVTSKKFGNNHTKKEFPGIEHNGKSK